jgi:phosphoglycolate phosphatase-like HAD superfamily hydrolase
MEDEMLAFLRAMCAHLGLLIPERSRGLEVMRRAEIHVCRHPDAVVPGTREVIVELSHTWHVHMATGNPSWRVEALLEGLGLLDVVRTRCGPDLVDARKLTPHFFERVFRLAGALPTEAAVVDDNTEPLWIAARLGARTIHVTSACDGPCEATLHIDSILELPAALLHLV